MAKRRAGTDLTDRNWDVEEEPEEPGTYEVAGKDVLAKRVIKKAKRRVKIGQGEESEQDESSKPSPFVGFTFGANKPSAGFSFKATVSDAATTPSFSLKPSVPSNPPAMLSADTVVLSSGSSGLSSFGSGKSSAPLASTNGTGAMTSAKLTTPSASSQQYTQKLQNLNRSVSAWIQKHVNENPVCDLTPVFEDYKKHLQEIEKLRNQEPERSTNTLQTEKKSDSLTITRSASSTFSFGKSSDSKQQAEQSSDPVTVVPPASSTFSFGKSSDTKQEVGQSKTDFSFKVTSSGPTSGFSFGRSDTEPVGFSAGKTETSGTGSLFGSAKPFSFGIAKSSESPTPEVSQTADDEEEYVPPKEEVKTVEEKDSLFSKRCKLFYKKGDAYKDRGVGMLHLKKLGSTLQLLVRADTSLGNVILNIMVPESLPVSRQGKNNIIVVTPINPPVDSTCPKCNKKYPRPQDSNVCVNGCNPEATALLIRVKTGDEADEVLQQINKLRGA